MNSKKKVVAITSIMIAVLLLGLSCILEIDLLLMLFCLLGTVSAGVFMGEERYWAVGWLLLFFVIIVTVSINILAAG